ncbi:unnamed protein product [Medioppia subpectinata]|uniref:RING-type domain-containing protein n=1 Tax=Medioppia subpectinata TaxID=1979941 RepID=A0A7R9KCF8_9ACAR|nr:unnamed protein product [Medioppia subpectinata]CAG2100084.1 unnamed protein product [Medioppia subpectinata]
MSCLRVNACRHPDACGKDTDGLKTLSEDLVHYMMRSRVNDKRVEQRMRSTDGTTRAVVLQLHYCFTSCGQKFRFGSKQRIIFTFDPMVGLSRDRFPDLLVDPMKLLVEELTCGICHQIYDNPVETHCRHTYCLHCLKELVSKHGQKLCPECRKSLTTRKRTQSAINDNNVVIINGNVIVDKNGKVNAMVGKLRTKCDFEAKGCPNVCPLESLPAHLKICPFKKCETCGQPLEATNQLLEWKDKYKNLDKEKKLLAEKMRQLETKVKESEEKTLKLESELKRKDTSHKSMVQKYEELEKSLKTPDFGIDFVIRLTSVPNLVMLGKCTANVGSVEFSEYGIALNNVLPNGCQTESIDRLYMPYERIQRLYSCVSVMPSLSMLCIKPRNPSEHDRFPDLSTEPMKLIAQELTCGICHQIYDNPVETYCKHTYCLQCLQELVTIYDQKSCPECRKSLTTRKRTQSAINNKDVVIIDSNVIVDKNRKVKAMVGKLRTKCDFEAKGCRTVCPLESLPSHLNMCRYKTCNTCGQSMDAKKELIEWKDNYKLLENESKLSAEKTRQLEKKVEESMEKAFDFELKYTSDRNEWQTKCNELTERAQELETRNKELEEKALNLESNCNLVSDRTEWQLKCNELTEIANELLTKAKESEKKAVDLELKVTSERNEWQTKCNELTQKTTELEKTLKECEDKVESKERQNDSLSKEWLKKYNQLENSRKQLVRKYEELEKSLKTPEVGVEFVIQLTSVPNLVMLGKCNASVGSVEFSEYGIALNNVLPNGCQTESNDRIYLSYEYIQCLYACVSVCPLLSLLCIKPNGNQIRAKNAMKEVFLVLLRHKCRNNREFEYKTIDLKTGRLMLKGAKGAIN